MTTGRKEYNFKRTLKYDSKWLDSKLINGLRAGGEMVVGKMACYERNVVNVLLGFASIGCKMSQLMSQSW